MKFNLPPVLAIDELWNGNPIRQLLQPSCLIEADVANYTSPSLKGKLLISAKDANEKILIVEKSVEASSAFNKVLKAKLNGSMVRTELSSDSGIIPQILKLRMIYNRSWL